LLAANEVRVPPPPPKIKRCSVKKRNALPFTLTAQSRKTHLPLAIPSSHSNAYTPTRLNTYPALEAPTLPDPARPPCPAATHRPCTFSPSCRCLRVR
jgi:hypothetical protein